MSDGRYAIAREDAILALIKQEDQFLLAQFGSMAAFIDAHLKSAPDPKQERKMLRETVESVFSGWDPLSYEVASNRGEIDRGLTLISLFAPKSGWTKCMELLRLIAETEDRPSLFPSPLAVALHAYFPRPPKTEQKAERYTEMVEVLSGIFLDSATAPAFGASVLALLLWFGAATDDCKIVAPAGEVADLNGRMPFIADVSASMRNWACGADLDRCTDTINTWIERATSSNETKSVPEDFARSLFQMTSVAN